MARHSGDLRESQEQNIQNNERWFIVIEDMIDNLLFSSFSAVLSMSIDEQSSYRHENLAEHGDVFEFGSHRRNTASEIEHQWSIQPRVVVPHTNTRQLVDRNALIVVVRHRNLFICNVSCDVVHCDITEK